MKKKEKGGGEEGEKMIYVFPPSLVEKLTLSAISYTACYVHGVRSGSSLLVNLRLFSPVRVSRLWYRNYCYPPYSPVISLTSKKKKKVNWENFRMGFLPDSPFLQAENPLYILLYCFFGFFLFLYLYFLRFRCVGSDVFVWSKERKKKKKKIAKEIPPK